MSNVNPYQSKVGKPRKAGTHFPETDSGDHISVFAAPAHWGEDPAVCVVVNLHAASLTPREARQLAQFLLHHADSSERQQCAS